MVPLEAGQLGFVAIQRGGSYSGIPASIRSPTRTVQKLGYVNRRCHQPWIPSVMSPVPTRNVVEQLYELLCSDAAEVHFVFDLLNRRA